jgi:Rod binding domain-containing protein
MRPTASVLAGSTKVLSKTAFDKTAKDFESVFMAQMLKPMWEGIETDGMFGGGAGEDVMKDLLVQEYGKAMAQGMNSGLTGSITRAMIQMQEHANGARA